MAKHVLFFGVGNQNLGSKTPKNVIFEVPRGPERAFWVILSDYQSFFRVYSCYMGIKWFK